MKISLHSVSHSGTWGALCCLPLDKIITKTAEFGYDGIEIVAKRPHGSPLDLDTESRKRLKDFIKSNMLWTLEGSGRPLGFYDPGEIESGVDSLLQYSGKRECRPHCPTLRHVKEDLLQMVQALRGLKIRCP